MTREELIQLAIELGIADRHLSSADQAVADYGCITNEIVSFAAAVAAAEREACAKVCDDLPGNDTKGAWFNHDMESAAHECAEAIRARSSKCP